MTVKFEDYTRDEVQATLQWLFEQQYELTLTEVVEIRTCLLYTSHTFNITMAVFDVAQHVINASAGIIAGNTAIDASALETMEETLMAMDLGPLLGLFPVSYTHLDVYKRQVFGYADRQCVGSCRPCADTG